MKKTILAACVLSMMGMTTSILGQDSVTYVYDDLGRVVKATYSITGNSIVYTYDDAGNRTTNVSGHILDEDGALDFGPSFKIINVNIHADVDIVEIP